MKDKLTNYKPQQRNANKHTPRGMGVLEKSIQADGWIGAITVAADGETFDGSARIEVGVATGFEDAIVVESDGTRPIIHRRVDIATADDPRARRLGIAANRVAQLNLDFDIDELLASVADGVDLSAMFRQDELDALLQAAHGQDEEAAKDEPYSRKIETPIYQPSNVKPSVSSLFDDTKTQALIRDIQATEGLTDEQRQFLMIAAQRHTVLHFNKIADYYAHSDETMQRLMENNALVIIDFNRAIELGFVQLTKKIAEQVKDEYGK